MTNPTRRKRSEVKTGSLEQHIKDHVTVVIVGDHQRPVDEPDERAALMAKDEPTDKPVTRADVDRAVRHLEAEEPAGNDLFQSINAAKEPALPQGFQIIVESMQLVDVKATYDQLVAGLKLGGEARNDKGRLREALDLAEDSARLAHLLYCISVVEKERYDIDAAPVFGTMWNAAVETLEQEADQADQEAEEEKRDGKRSRKPTRKAITNEDVKSKSCAMFPDQWRRHHVGQERVKTMVLHLKELSDLWTQRCRSLEVLLTGAR